MVGLKQPIQAVSIHAPVRERQFVGYRIFKDYSFNSRSREGATQAGQF